MSPPRPRRHRPRTPSESSTRRPARARATRTGSAGDAARSTPSTTSGPLGPRRPETWSVKYSEVVVNTDLRSQMTANHLCCGSWSGLSQPRNRSTAPGHTSLTTRNRAAGPCSGSWVPSDAGVVTKGTLAAADGQLADERWAGITAGFVDRMGFTAGAGRRRAGGRRSGTGEHQSGGPLQPWRSSGTTSNHSFPLDGLPTHWQAGERRRRTRSDLSAGSSQESSLRTWSGRWNAAGTRPQAIVGG